VFLHTTGTPRDMHSSFSFVSRRRLTCATVLVYYHHPLQSEIAIWAILSSFLSARTRSVQKVRKREILSRMGEGIDKLADAAHLLNYVVSCVS
jgi:hypothetical protein